MKKICFVMTDSSQFNITCRGQLEYFKKSGEVDITLICGNWSNEVDKLRNRNVGHVKIFPIERKPSLLKDFYCLVLLFFHFLFHRYDVVVYSTPKGLLLGSLASFMAFQKKRISLIRGRAYENFKGSRRKIYELLDKICLMISHQVIFISKSMKNKYLEENIVIENKSVVIGSGSSNGVDIKKYYPLVCQKKHNDVNFNILIIGRICFEKGIFDLDKILCNLKNLDKITLNIVGRVEDNESQYELERLLKKYSCINYFEHIDNPVEFYQKSDLHLFLSHRDGFGNVAIEAASCGVPTFSYDIIGIQDSVNNGISGHRFMFQNYNEISKAIDNAIIDRDVFYAQFVDCHKWVKENFQDIVVWNNYLKFYIS